MALNEQISKSVQTLAAGGALAGGLADYTISSIYLYLSNKGKIERDDVLIKVAEDMLKPANKEMLERFNREIEALTNEGLYELLKYSIDNSFVRFDDSSSKELSELVLKLFGDLYGGPIMFDACSGRGNFLLNAFDYSLKKRFVFKDLFGVDINSQNVNLSNMVMRIVSYLNNTSTPMVKALNSMTDKFDFPITHAYVFPPLGLKFATREKSLKSKLFDDIEFTGRNTAEWIFIDNVLSQVDKHVARTITVVTARALFSEDDKEYRNKLIESGMLEGIIELPSGALEYSGVKLQLLVFSHDNKEVKTLDASEFYIKNKRQLRAKLDVERIYDSYMASNCKKFNFEELVNARNIAPSTLNVGEIKVKNGEVLGDLAEVFTGSQYTSRNFEDSFANEPTGYRILMSSDIENGVVDWKKLQSIKYEDTKFDKFAVKKGDVVVTSKSSKVKTVVVDIEPKEKILVTGGMIIVRPDATRLNPTYLKMFLDSSLGQASLKQIQKGATIITINSKDLATILVPMIDIEKQNEKADDYNLKLTTILGYKKEIERLERSLQESFDEGDEE
mgnify:CR=1 FL=1